MIEVNKLYFANCKDILIELPDNSIDLFLQDVPFEVTANEWDKGLIETLPEMWKLWIKKGKKNAAFVFKATFPFAIDLINSNRKYFKYEWVWEKNLYTNFVNAKKMPMRCLEYIFVFYNEQPTYNPILRKNKYPKEINIKNHNSISIYKIKGSYNKPACDFGTPVNLIKIDAEKDRNLTNNGSQNRHPNRTNPALWEYFIKTYTNEGDLIFDGYSGSGSVPQAAINTNRNWIACENSEEYFSDTEKRILNTQEIKKYGYAKTELTTNKNSLFFGQNL